MAPRSRDDFLDCPNMSHGTFGGGELNSFHLKFSSPKKSFSWKWRKGSSNKQRRHKEPNSKRRLILQRMARQEQQGYDRFSCDSVTHEKSSPTISSLTNKTKKKSIAKKLQSRGVAAARSLSCSLGKKRGNNKKTQVQERFHPPAPPRYPPRSVADCGQHGRIFFQEQQGDTAGTISTKTGACGDRGRLLHRQERTRTHDHQQLSLTLSKSYRRLSLGEAIALEPRHRTWYFSSNHVLVNQERLSRGFPPLTRSVALDSYARKVATRAALTHTLDPANSTRLRLHDTQGGYSRPRSHGSASSIESDTTVIDDSISSTTTMRTDTSRPEQDHGPRTAETAGTTDKTHSEDDDDDSSLTTNTEDPCHALAAMNILVGSSIRDIHERTMTRGNLLKERHNLLNPKYGSFGMATHKDPSTGLLYMCQAFGTSAANSNA